MDIKIIIIIIVVIIILPQSHAGTNYPSCCYNRHNKRHRQRCECSQRWSGCGVGLQHRSASDSSDSVALVTLAAFHGHIDFSPTLQIIAGCCESYPPQLAGRSRWSVLTRQCLSDFEESDILASHWLASTPVYFLPTRWVYLTAYQASCLFVPVGLPLCR